MRLRRLLTLLATVLAVLLVAEVAVRVLTTGRPEPVTWYHEIAQAKTEHLAELEGPLDYVFAGTSQTYHGIDPEVVDERLGTTSYNAGIPAAVPDVQRRWLLGTVLPAVEVDTVVWALSSVDLNAARPQRMAPVYDSAFATRGGVLAAADRWLADRSELFRYRRTLADPQQWFSDDDPLDRARRVLLSSGKRKPAGEDTSDAERHRIRRDVIGDYEPGGHMAATIRETVADLRRQGTDVVFAWLPEAPRYIELLPDERLHDEAEEGMRRLAADLGVPLLDLSEGYGDHDFVDFTHLDGDAAHRLSIALAGRLAGVRTG